MFIAVAPRPVPGRSTCTRAHDTTGWLSRALIGAFDRLSDHALRRRELGELAQVVEIGLLPSQWEMVARASIEPTHCGDCQKISEFESNRRSATGPLDPR
jgi:hypothetical protein